MCLFMSLILILQTGILLPPKANTHILALVYCCPSYSFPMTFVFVDTSRTVNQASLKKLRAKNYQGSDDEWAEILSYALGQLPATSSNQDWAADVETSASISGPNGEDKTMAITVRKRIQKITVCSFVYCTGYQALVLIRSTAKTRFYNAQTRRRTVTRTP